MAQVICQAQLKYQNPDMQDAVLYVCTIPVHPEDVLHYNDFANFHWGWGVLMKHTAEPTIVGAEHSMEADFREDLEAKLNLSRRNLGEARMVAERLRATVTKLTRERDDAIKGRGGVTQETFDSTIEILNAQRAEVARLKETEAGHTIENLDRKIRMLQGQIKSWEDDMREQERRYEKCWAKKEKWKGKYTALLDALVSNSKAQVLVLTKDQP